MKLELRYPTQPKPITIGAMTENQRMSEFAHTGDTVYLSLEDAKKMNLPQEFIDEIIARENVVTDENSAAVFEFYSNEKYVLNNIIKDSCVREKFKIFLALTDRVYAAKVVSNIIDLHNNSHLFLQIGNEILQDSMELGLDADYNPFNTEFLSWMIEKSINSRLESVCMGLGHIAEGSNVNFTIEDINLALAGIGTLLDILSFREHFTFSRNETNQKQEGVIWIDVQNGNNKYVLKFFHRPFDLGYGEARFSFELYLENLDNDRLKELFTYRTEFKDGKTKEQSLVRFSFDLDKRSNRLSFDIGRSDYSGQNFSRKGDIVGNILSNIRHDGHHDMESFPENLSEEKQFALFCLYMNWAVLVKTGIGNEDEIEEASKQIHQLLLVINGKDRYDGMVGNIPDEFDFI